jgi:hypothetical protein
MAHTIALAPVGALTIMEKESDMSPTDELLIEWMGLLLGQAVIVAIPLCLFLTAYGSRIPAVQIITCLLLFGATYYTTLLWWESYILIEQLTFTVGFQVLLCYGYSLALVAQLQRKILLPLPALATMLGAWFLAHLVILSNYSKI